MSDGKKPLTDPPKNLKEAIDWLALVRGGYGGSRSGGPGKPEKLEAALMQLPGFAPIYKPKFLGDSLSYYIYRYAQGLGSGFLGYNGNAIVATNGTYTSAYSGASWSDNSAFEYAKIFLFLVCLAFYFITFLYWMCKDNGRWENGTFTVSNAPGKFFEAMGYDTWDHLRSTFATNAASALQNILNAFPELQEAYKESSASSYEDFLQQLDRVGPSKRPEYPLANCKVCSYEYLQSRHSGADVTAAIDKIRAELVRLSKNRNISYSSNFSALQQKVQNLLGTIKSFDPNAVPSPVAPVAPLAGTLTTLAAAGGAGAAYGLNLGGFQSILKALFGFK
ncbi:variant erythrocyte surface antigen-1 family protein [Babesia caballi]|uniref:Variant erythrocyte surface antigen-1 family protein n=1 Tax=Babesia caballi TaxID=5871 RepID=A0AAV4LP58_BABCB|nr:variant erythrocyte surface antigen-1 family protein [Babesia caballi]